MYQTPQRSYSNQALELWFERLGRDWEADFSPEELAWGRHAYRTMEVRSTELLENSAIVHFKRGREPLYVVIDADPGRFTFRESHPGLAPGLGLGVAGLYEIEELIADEIPAVPTERKKAAPDPEHKPMPAQPQRPTERVGRRLRARLGAAENGLRLELGWEVEGAVNWDQFVLRDLTPWEREQLIGYAARALHSRFRSGGREGLYRMQDPAAVEQFMARDCRVWRERFGLILLPEVVPWQGGPRAVRPTVTVEGPPGGARFRMDFSFAGQVLGPVVRERLWRHPGHVHFVPGEGIFRIAPEAVETVQEWRALLPETGEGRLPPYLLFALEGRPELQIHLTEELSAWRRSLETVESKALAPLADYLRPYQRDGVAWMSQRLRAGCHPLLADEMGLGKTLQVLNLLQAESVLNTEPVLVVCPASVVPVWQAEVARYFPEVTTRVVSRDQPFAVDSPALWICSYTQLRRNKADLERVAFSHAILDEAQTIKNPDAKVTHACGAIRSRHRLALTGTPIENHPLDLWTLFRFLMPGLLGSRRHFEEACKRDAAFAEAVKARVLPFVLRRTKQAVAADLPEKVEIDWPCPLLPRQRRAYEALLEGAGAAIQGSYGAISGRERLHVFTLLTRLRQASCSPSMLPDQGRDWQQSGKLVSLCSRLAEALDGGSKVVVFSQFVQFLREAREAVREVFPEAMTFELTGSTVDRERPVTAFREAPGGAVFFVSLRAGGTGLNLQVADYVFLLDPWWNPAVEAQAIDRVHRIGQQNRVMVYRFITKGTIEDRIQILKRQKADLFDQVFSEMEAPAALLEQFETLHDLVQLDPEA
jgi:hypothetical protein